MKLLKGPNRRVPNNIEKHKEIPKSKTLFKTQKERFVFIHNCRKNFLLTQTFSNILFHKMVKYYNEVIRWRPKMAIIRKT